jgi:hypothetical protein
MPKDDDTGVLTCPLCGLPDDAMVMLEVHVEKRNAVWPQVQVICSRCAAAVGQAIHRELSAYNEGETGDDLLHFGLAPAGDSSGIDSGDRSEPDHVDSPDR